MYSRICILSEKYRIKTEDFYDEEAFLVTSFRLPRQLVDVSRFSPITASGLGMFSKTTEPTTNPQPQIKRDHEDITKTRCCRDEVMECA